MVKYSIIIPVKAINDYVRETVPHIQALASKEWELIILPNDDSRSEWGDERIKIISSGKIGPAGKRDMGANVALGEILVFLDDDSYPDPDLLEVASRYFEDSSVVALGGPAITPLQDSFWQKVSGAVFLSRLSGGVPERYVPIGNVRPVDDWPSVNLMVRKDAFINIGGFDSPYWPGEDTKLCLDLIQKTKMQILYIPEMRVWHHRRTGLIPHLKQIGGYGIHRGHFARKYPKTSRKPLYFLPSAFFLFVLGSVFSVIYWPNSTIFFLFGWLLYCVALFKAWLDMCKYETRSVAAIAIAYTVATHFWYGIRFIQGLLTPVLVSRLR